MADLPVIYTVRLDVREEVEDEFNDWASGKHISDLMGAGFLSAVRFRSVKGEPKYLHLYELGSVNVLSSPKYASVMPNDKAGADLQEAVFNHSAAIFRQEVALNVPDAVGVSEGSVGGVRARHMITVSMEVAPDSADELIRWHREEHMPMLLEAQGMLTGRLCRRSGLHPDAPCHDPEWLSIYEMQSPDTLKDPKVKAANETEWAQRMHSVTTDANLGILERIAPA